MTLKFTWGFNIHIWFPPLESNEFDHSFSVVFEPNLKFHSPQKSVYTNLFDIEQSSFPENNNYFHQWFVFLLSFDISIS